MMAVERTVPCVGMELSGPVDSLRALALAARDGEGAAFAQLYGRTREMAFRTIARVVGSSADVEDLVQDSYVHLFRALKTYRGSSKVTTFLRGICVNVALMHLRSKRRKPQVLDGTLEPYAPQTEGPEHAAQVQQAAIIVRRVLDELGEKKAAVFMFSELLDLKPDEIAVLCECPVNTVRSRLHRARADFVTALNERLANDRGRLLSE